MKSLRQCFTLIGTLFLINSTLSAGEEEKAKTVLGKVVDYQPKEKIIIQTTADTKKEFTISKDATVTNDVKKGSFVKIETQETGTSETVKKIEIQKADVAGPGYNPTPVSRK